MQSYEKLKTIYEIIAPHITRSEYNWKDYLTYASRFFKKHSFDNILLSYAQDPTATVLASMVDWNKGGRSVNKGGKGIAVCEYENAKLTLSHLFDIAQTNGREIMRTDWQLDADIKQALTRRLSYAHGLQANDFFMTLYSLAGETVAENYEVHLKDLTPDKDGHIFNNLPAKGFEAQFIDLLTDSVTWFAAKRCGLRDEEITLSDGMATVHHFNTIPLVARLGNAVTLLSRGILLEVERTIKIENSERSNTHERIDDKSQLHREGRNIVPESANLQRERERRAPRQIRQDGAGISAIGTPSAFYDFENGWQSNGNLPQRSDSSDRKDRKHNTENAPIRPDAGHGGHDGEDTPPEQPASDSGGNGNARLGAGAEIVVNTAEREPEGSFSLPETDDEPDFIGSYNIPDEVSEMSGQPDSIFDYVLDIVAEYAEPNTVSKQLTMFERPERTPNEMLAFLLSDVIGATYEGGKQRIYDCAVSSASDKELATMIKNEYGTGGQTVNKNGIHFVNYGSNGLSFDWKDENGVMQDASFRWNTVAIVFRNLIENNMYSVDRIITSTNEPLKKDLLDAADESQIIASDDAPQIRIIEEALNAHHGQVDMLMQAVRNELTVGMTEYSIFEDAPHISMIQVLEGFRRQGIATAMVQHLQEQFPDTVIEWGMLTEDGAAFHAAVTYTEPNKRYEVVAGNIEGLDEQISEYQSVIDGGGILSDSQGEDWNDLESLQYEYEQELRTLKPERTFIRRPQENTPVDAPKSVKEIAPAIYSNNFRYSDSYNLYPNGEKTKYKNNIEAIRLLKAIESEHRTATQEEQIVLARYVGWGGLANAFSDKASGWEKEYQELKLHLNDKEYKEARLSTITAYYTEPELIRHIYSALERFGFQGGADRKLLDPAMGTGNFFSVLPDSLAGTKLHGIELDGITGRIAKRLYPNANISITGYESSRLSNDSFDVIIGNIPFNNIKVRDKRYEEHENWHIHDYFFGHSLDLVKPGGIIAFITSQATMDRNDDSVRRYIAERAEFIGAVRLPNNAFKQLAGTEVTTDIIFLQKRNEQIHIPNYDSDIEWLDTKNAYLFLSIKKCSKYKRKSVAHKKNQLDQYNRIVKRRRKIFRGGFCSGKYAPTLTVQRACFKD